MTQIERLHFITGYGCRIIFLLLLLVVAENCLAQDHTLFVFDLVNHTMDSITGVPYDSAQIRDRTMHWHGTADTLTEWLDQEPPVNNVYPGSQFTRKERAAATFEVSRFPLRTSVKLSVMVDDTLRDNCSGSLVSRRHVLTAAHCVASLLADTLSFDSLYACPAFDNGDPHPVFPCSWVNRIYLFRDWAKSGRDIALLELNEPVGEITGWIGMGFDTDNESLLSGIFYKFTYPATTIPFLDSAEYNGDTLYFSYGKADMVDDPRFIGIKYASGIPGESGSSLIRVINNLQYTTYGVLVWSNGLMHTRIDNWKYYYLESVIHNDLSYGTWKGRRAPTLGLYPNPASETVRLEVPGTGRAKGVAVTDAYGQTVLNINTVTNTIDIRSLPIGIYLVRVWEGRNVYTEKLVVGR